MKHYLFLIITIQLVNVFNVQASENLSSLGFIDKIDRILIEENEQQAVRIYSEKSLFESLPKFHRANIDGSLGFGKVWSWQRGAFILNNGKRINWRTFAKHLILIETDDGPIFYTDAISISRRIVDNRLITTFYTSNGSVEFSQKVSNTSK